MGGRGEEGIPMGAPLWGRCLLGCLYGVPLLGAPYECVPMGVSLWGGHYGGCPYWEGVPVGGLPGGAAVGASQWGCPSWGVSL